ncbi:hypothetical protein [Candidatus Aciduliprofundum boonei]|uniref:Uncharacterized protein n=1 Tax=Aciduliprofundum boonei (strain DSM 19572 / T469) TaxID=439481 RepID=B5I9T1_ACIB4|nr:hypothetical protein [Candidatus Aciduliprofundum boonei]ADD08439.1 conserved hypothetical protein [Aciduliprofundum boonei T469]EDY36688.1 hypothetical protein ABOONEI_1609 [Aciduliprofundum boonei T469]HII55482.1 hypothetical protein [Candidatus Aciduliprofundum boonei]
MEILLKTKGGRKKKCRIYTNNVGEIEYLSKKLGISKEKVLEDVILGNRVDDDDSEEIAKLNDEINGLLQEMFILERKWAGMRYKAYSYMKENRAVAISLAGYLAKNKNIRNLMNMKREHKDMEKIVDKYLWM